MKIILSIVALCTASIAFSQQKSEKNCSDFHTGKYKIVDEKIGFVSYVERFEDYQIETVEGQDTYLKADVEWIDECTYSIGYIESNDERINSLPKDERLIIEIISTTSNSYTFVSHMKQYDLEVVGKAIRIE